MSKHTDQASLSTRTAGSVLAILSYAIPPVVALSIWQYAVWRAPQLTFIFGSPTGVLSALIEDCGDGELWNHLLLTALEALSGLSLGVISGCSCALVLWRIPRLARMVRPYLIAAGSVPIFAIAPMLIMWFGTGFTAKVMMSGIAVFFVALTRCYESACECSDRYDALLILLQVPYRAFIAKIVIPGMLRSTASNLKMCISVSILGAFIGEFVSSTAGLGHYILTASSLYDTPRAILGLILLSTLALSANLAVVLLEYGAPRYFLQKERTFH